MIRANVPSHRCPETFSDALQLYRARIVSKPDPGDDRLQIRIMPHMIDIKDTDLLPYWPMFFSTNIITGLTEKEDGKDAEYVWCAATPDFTVGYVMGIATSFGSADKLSKQVRVLDFQEMIQGLMTRGICPKFTDFRNLYIQYWNNEFIEMVNIKTGDKFTILSNGTILALHGNQIYMRVGSKKPYSSIVISQDEIAFCTTTFRVKASNVILGSKGLSLAAVSGLIPIQSEGMTIHPQTNIKV